MYNIENNKNFITKFSSKKFYSSNLINVMEFNDFHNIVLTNIFTRIGSYDSKKGKLLTFLGIIINTTFLEELQKLSCKKRNIYVTKTNLSIDYNYSDGNEKSNTFENYIETTTLEEQLENSEKYIIEKYTNVIEKEKDKKILKLLYLGYNIKDITKLMNFKSRTSTVQAITRIQKQITLNI